MIESGIIFLEKFLTVLLGKRRAHFIFLVLYFIKREMIVRYQESFLGYVWAILKPLMMMAILTAVFSNIIRGVDNYPLFILVGLIFWGIAADSLNRGVRAITDSASLIRRMNVPIWVFPSVCVGSACITLVFSLIVLGLFFLYYHHPFYSSILSFPVIFLIYFVFIFSATIILSTLYVFFRDLGHIIDPIMSLLFYGTPIIYSPEMIPERYRSILELNPFFHFITYFRGIFLYGTVPEFSSLLKMTGFVCIFFLIAMYCYKKLRSNIVYHL